MAGRFSGYVVALVVLLFVTTEGLRSTQVDDHRATSRGTLRFQTTSKLPEEATTLPSRSQTARSRSSQSKGSPSSDRRKETILPELKFDSARQSSIKTTRTTEGNSFSTTTETPIDSRRNPLGKNREEVKRVEPVNRRNGRRFPSENKEESKLNDDQKTKGTSRRTSRLGATERLDSRGPSVFQATTESSRSRTGRKIQTAFSKKDAKTQISSSRRYSNKSNRGNRNNRFLAESTTISLRRGRSTTEKIDRSTRSGRSKTNPKENDMVTIRNSDAILSESESVRIDIPLTVNRTENPIFDTTTSPTLISQRRSDNKESRSNPRTSTERSKARGRSNDVETHGPRTNRRGSSKFNDRTTTEAADQTSTRRTVSRDRSRGSETKKNSIIEPRSRSRSRNSENSVTPTSTEREVKRKVSGDRRSRVLDVTSRSVENRVQDTQDTRRSRSRPKSDVSTPSTTTDVTTVASDTTVSSYVTTTANSEITGTTSTRSNTSSTTPSPRTTTTRSSSTSTSTTEASGRGRGRGKGRRQQKEDFFNQGLGFRGRKPVPEGSLNTTEIRRTVPSRNETQIPGYGWTLRRRPGYFNNSENASRQVLPSARDQTNEVIPPNEISTSTEVVTTVETSTRRGFMKVQTTDESTTVAGEATTKSNRRGNNKAFGLGKTTAELEESDNYPPEFKAKLSQLNVSVKLAAPKTTSKSPLEVKRSSAAALFAERSRMKLDLARRLVKPELNIEENDLDATTASSSFSKIGDESKTGRAEIREEEAKTVSSGSGKDLARKLKKGRIIAERMVTSISVQERSAIEGTTEPYQNVLSNNNSSTEERSVNTSRIHLLNRGGNKSKEERSSKDGKSNRRPEHNDRFTTFKPKKSHTYQSRNSKYQESNEQNSTTSPKKSYVSTQGRPQASQEEDVTKKPKFGIGKPTFRPRYSKRAKLKSEQKSEYLSTVTTEVPISTSRYSRKKAVKAIDEKLKSITTEVPASQTKKLEFRPRTSTYRRHSEVPTTLVQSTPKSAGVAITPRSSRLQSTPETSTETLSVSQEPQVSLTIANQTQETTGITGSSNGDSGNTNIFNPTRSTEFLVGNDTVLEQLRSTVAPLLSSLGNKTPVFSGSYSNVNTANSPPRITPSGQPPRFSARYKGAELFIRKPNSIYQPTVPSITSSSTTPVTPVEVFTRKVAEEMEAVVAPPSWTDRVIATTTGSLDSNLIDAN